jgi:hypothetical protein
MGEPTAYGTRQYAQHLGLTVRRQGNKLMLRERYRAKKKIGEFRSWSAVEREIQQYGDFLVKIDGWPRPSLA